MFTNRIKVFKDSQSRWNFLQRNFKRWCFLPGFARGRPLRAKTATFANPGWADDWQGEAFQEGFAWLTFAKVEERVKEEDEVDTRRGKVIKFGWIEGVLMRWNLLEEADRILMIRCLLNIWGTMLFLRLTWVIGQMGIWQVSQNITDQNQSGHKMTENNQGLMVITACNIITGLSALSMSAISTNGQIAAGGVYYMISRFLEKF